MSRERVQELIVLEKHGEAPEYVLFWGGPFSNFWLKNFKVKGVEYTCVEQYMMSEKARLFGDKQKEKEIMNETDQKRMQSLGRKVKDFENSVWDREKEAIVKKGLIAKYTQNECLKEELIKTGTKILVEASPYDRVWGIGYGKWEEESKRASEWRGDNLLGFLLTDLREELENEKIY